MAVMPDPVYTRRLALVAEYGYSAAEVTADGFTSEYFTVFGDLPIHPSERDAAYVEIYEANALQLWRIYWHHSDIGRAKAAIEGDFQEMFGALPTSL